MTTRLRRAVTVMFGPLWVRTFRDPVREGHLRLDSLSRTERQLARFGLVLLAILLASVLFSETWRGGTLVQLTGDNELRFLPVAVLPLTVLGLVLGWALLCWGALDASPLVRVLVLAILLSPAGWFVGIMDAYLAHHLYSADVPTASSTALTTRATWRAFKVPLPPERRLFAQYFQATCRPGDTMTIVDPRWWFQSRGEGRRRLECGPP